MLKLVTEARGRRPAVLLRPSGLPGVGLRSAGVSAQRGDPGFRPSWRRAPVFLCRLIMPGGCVQGRASA